LQSWEWGEWQEALGRQAFRFWVLDDNRQTFASVQLIKMPLLFGKHYFYCPYGPTLTLPSPASHSASSSWPRGGRGEGERVKFKIEDLRFILEEIKNKFPNAVFVRLESKGFIADLASIAKKSLNIQPAKTLIINLAKSEEGLLAEMHPKTRYNIRLAQKHKVIIEKDLVVTPRHGLYFKEILEQIIETTKRQGYKGHSKDYYISLINFFALKKQDSSLKIHIYKALFQKQLLTSGIMVDFGNTRTYLFGGSSQNFKHVMAPHLLHWQAIMDAKETGFKFYDFWGIETSSGKTAGFARFKLGFAPPSASILGSRGQSDPGSSTPRLGSGSSAGQIENYPGAYDIVQDKVWYQLYRISRFLNRLFK
jgi:lipid II:glycine glycyltransferase (peptidoglycan interpeptide bridge formation enzyme)